MITIIDYGAGNLFSVQNALNFLGVENNISSKVEDIISADKLILPGVGAFPDAMKMLDEAGLTEVIKEQAKKKALMGICLGMQMLFDKSYEFGETEGLGLIPGTVELMHPANNLVIPHIGWNSLEKNEPCKLLESVNDGDYVYFVHSYAAVTDSKNVAAYCDYGMKVPALVMSGNVYGCQFHPEKSGNVGLSILKAFCELLMDKLICSCGGKLKQGFFSGGLLPLQAQVSVEFEGYGVAVSPVTAYVCTKCGKVELYADKTVVCDPAEQGKENEGE